MFWKIPITQTNSIWLQLHLNKSIRIRWLLKIPRGQHIIYKYQYHIQKRGQQWVPQWLLIKQTFLWACLTLREKCLYLEFFGPYFPPFGRHTERYSVSLRIQSEYGKIRTRKLRIWTLFAQCETSLLNDFQKKKTGKKRITWLYFIDDVFFIWTNGEDSLKEFLVFCQKYSEKKNMKSVIKFEILQSTKTINLLDVSIP